MSAARYPVLRWGPRADGSALARVDIEFAAPLTAGQAKEVVDVVDSFCRVAALGGFGDPSGPAGASACRRRSHQPIASGVRFEIECSGIDHRAFQVLRNLLAALNLGKAGVKSLSVAADALRWPETTVAPQVDDDNEERCYPPLHPSVRFGYDEDDDEDVVVESWFRRCVVTLHGSVEQKHVDAMTELVVPWFEILESNGYAMPVDWPKDVANSADSVGQFEDNSIEITVMRFQSSEEAWLPLANIVWANAGSIGLPVHNIVVDP